MLGGNGFSLPDSPGNRNPVELDESSTESKISKSKVVQKEIKSAPAAKGRKKRGRTRADLQEPIEFEEKEETNEPQSEFCPVRGQKAAWKRLNKMRGLFMQLNSLFRNLMNVFFFFFMTDDLAKQTEEVVEPIPKGKSNPKQKQKQNGTARKRRNQSRQERDIVDLISSPDLVLPGTINLDSDEELEHTKMTTRSKADQLQASFSSENTEIIIKVKYTSEIMEFPLRPVSYLYIFLTRVKIVVFIQNKNSQLMQNYLFLQYQKFSDLIEQMSNGNGFDCKNILLTFKDKIISHSSTPNSVGYTPGLIICKLK